MSEAPNTSVAAERVTFSSLKRLQCNEIVDGKRVVSSGQVILRSNMNNIVLEWGGVTINLTIEDGVEKSTVAPIIKIVEGKTVNINVTLKNLSPTTHIAYSDVLKYGGYPCDLDLFIVPIRGEGGVPKLISYTITAVNA